MSVGRSVRTSSSRVGSVRSVNGGWTCQAIGSSAVAQFWRAPVSASVQVLNQRASVRFSSRRVADQERTGGRRHRQPGLERDDAVHLPAAEQAPDQAAAALEERQR